MKRLLLAIALLAPLAASGQLASPFTFYVHDPTGATPDIPLPAAYQLTATPVGGSNSTVLRMVNSSQDTVYFVSALMSTGAASLAANPNFSVTGLFADETLAPSGDLLFTVNFTPSVVGSITGFLNIEFQIQQNGCSFTDSANPCPSGSANVSSMTGTATSPLLTLSYQTAAGPLVLLPSGASPLNFPNTSLSATSTITFTLTNQTAVDTTAPAISLPSVNQNVPSAFELDISAVPTTIAAGQSANFNVTFAPGQVGYANGILQVGSNSYPIAGEGVAGTGASSLQISYTDSTGVLRFPQAATPISFGQLLPGAGANVALTFSVTNPATSSGSVTVSSVAVSGPAFSLASAPAAPIVIAPGASIVFSAIFTPTSAGDFTGSLSIGSVQFSLDGVGAAISSPFSFYLHDTTGKTPDTPFPSTYQVAETPVGGATPTVLKMVNSSQNTVYFISAIMSNGATSLVTNPNFTVTGLFADETLPPGGDLLFTVNFAPQTAGTTTGFLDVQFQIQQNGCSFTSSVNGCPSGQANVSTLTGTATSPLLILSYQSASGPVVLLPSSAAALNFPDTSLSATSTYTFTLTNETAVAATIPPISLPAVNLNEPGAFTLDTSTLPATIAGGGSANFSVTFAPGQTGYTNGILQLGPSSCTATVTASPFLSTCYPIAGEGIIVAAVDALLITYTNSTGVSTSPQAATPIAFGQLVSGSGSNVELKFYLTLNPNASQTSVDVPSITVSGAAFSLLDLPALPVTIPSQTVTFKVVFTPTSSSNFTGTLSIGGRTFSLIGGGVPSPFPGATITLGAPPIGSDQQATLSVQLSPPLTSASVLTLMLQFAPSVQDAAATTDSAIAFGTGGEQLTLNLPAGATTATYADASGKQQSGIPFQTGTTAGTITFSLFYLGSQIYAQPFKINPAPVQILSVQASRESPNLVVTIKEGYDNTYSASQLTYTFYDTSGNVIGTTFKHDESAAFQQLFFNDNTGGGLFSLQSIFPLVTGDVTQVGSVTVGVTNQVTQTTASATFQ